MAAEDETAPSNGQDEPALPATSASAGKGGKATLRKQPQRAQTRSRALKRAPSVHREPAVNAIQQSRRPRKDRNAAREAASATEDTALGSAGKNAAATASAAIPIGVPRGDSDPWTVPQSVRDRFVQDGHRFYFPDGAPAFKDQGRRLTTPSENTQVIHSLIEIAHSRGWSEVTVTGTDRFRQEAWRQACMAGFSVRGYRPTELEHAQLVRAMGRNLPRSGERVEGVSADREPGGPRTSTATVHEPPGKSDAALAETPKERITGRLLDHGRDAYRHDPDEEASYFVAVQTLQGRREIWGKDLERAMTKSLTQPQVGDEVMLRRTGREAVTVKRPARDGGGQLKEKEVETYRNRWVIETAAFFQKRAQAARVVRDASIDPRAAVREHPELTGTYLNLRAAELAARQLRDPQDRRRFVTQVRAALADDIERGEPLQPVRLREGIARASRRAAREEDRAPVR